MVDSHLETCPKCSQELSALKDYLTLMHSLGRVKAPPGFAEDLADRLKKPSLFTRLAWRFAKPFPLRIPLGAAGALAALLVLIFSYVEFFTHRPSVPEPEAPAIHRDQSGFSSPQPYKKEEVPEVVASRAPLAVDGKDDVRGTETGDATFRVVLRLRPETGPQEAERGTGGFNVPKASLGGIQSRVRLKESSKPMLRVEPQGIEGNKGELSDGMSESVSSPSRGGDIAKDERSRKGVFEEIERIVKTLGGKIVAEESGKEGVCFSSLTVRLDHHNYPSFLNQLKRFGTLEFSNVEQPVSKDLPLEITLSVCLEGDEKGAAE